MEITLNKRQIFRVSVSDYDSKTNQNAKNVGSDATNIDF